MLDNSRGPKKTWVYGALRVTGGAAVTMTAPSRSSPHHQHFLAEVEAAAPGRGTIFVITDSPSSHHSYSTRTWLEGHPRIQHVFITVGACWPNLQEGWWRIFRHHAKRWIRGQPPPPPQDLRRRFVQTFRGTQHWVRLSSPPSCAHSSRSRAEKGAPRGRRLGWGRQRLIQRYDGRLRYGAGGQAILGDHAEHHAEVGQCPAPAAGRTAHR
ncbi:transposase [Streptomyces sp. NPDC021098]|uniref:transposase n=1 Tax=unclassified Streptomyces TaxID=2593676 RepID=UPI003790BBB1